MAVGIATIIQEKKHKHIVFILVFSFLLPVAFEANGN
jgi:hypothetical protein